MSYFHTKYYWEYKWSGFVTQPSIVQYMVVIMSCLWLAITTHFYLVIVTRLSWQKLEHVVINHYHLK